MRSSTLSKDVRDLTERVATARGERPAHLVLRNTLVPNIFTRGMRPADVAIHGKTIVGLGSYRGEQEIDCAGDMVLPGFIDGHLHLEGTHLTPAAFAEAALPHGTSAIVLDPHEIANVAGADGVRWLIAAARELPIDVYFMVPSCVPSSPLETAGAHLAVPEVAALLRTESALGLAEVMDVPGVLHCSPDVLEKLVAASLIDGHCPGLSGRDLCAYLVAGPASDHEIATAEEACEKLALGTHLMIRGGSIAPSLHLLPGLLDTAAADRISLVTDDLSVSDLVERGHVDELLRRAVGCGVDPLLAVRMVTLNTARYFGLPRAGAVAPAYAADLVTVRDLHTFEVTRVVKQGRVVYEHGVAWPTPPALPEVPAVLRSSVRTGRVDPRRFRVPGTARTVEAIDVLPGRLATARVSVAPARENGELLADPEHDIAKIAVVERHRGSGRVGVGFVRGLGLRTGALASTFSHDAHNLVVAGTSDGDMAAAATAIIETQGGLAACRDGELLGRLALPLGGLLSTQPAVTLAGELRAVEAAARALGVTVNAPFTVLSFLTLAVVPALRITDLGVVDVERQIVLSAGGPEP